MGKLDDALRLVEEWYTETYREYDEDGEYYDATPKEWGRYRKIVDNLKAFGAAPPKTEPGEGEKQ